MSYIRKHKKNGKIYLEEVKSVRVDGKVVQKHIRYIGKEVDNKTILSASISNMSVEKVQIHGPLLVLNYLCESIGLLDILGEYGNEILSLVFAHCIDYKSINKMSSWFERTDLNMILDLEDLTEKRLLNALDSIEKFDLEKIQTKIFSIVKRKYKLNTDSVIYDVTNTYLYGKKCPIGKLGKDKEGIKGRPLIQIGLGVTRKDGVPIFHKTFNGNISDSRTLHDLITSIESYNINNGLIIYDRGITSKSNIKNIKKLGWNTICGIASNSKLKNIAKSLIMKNTFVDIKNRVKVNKSVFYVIKVKYHMDEIEGQLLVCFNEQKASDLRESRYDEIQNAHTLLREGVKIKDGLDKFFLNNNKINHKAVEKEAEFDGFSFIFSTKNIPTDEAIKLYFSDKDIVEKAFHSLKGIIKVRPIRHWLYNRVTAHIFICYLSYLLLSLLRLKLSKTGISPLEALEELGTLYKVYIKDKEKGFKLSRTVALTTKQEKILKTINKDLLEKCSG